MGTIAKLSRHGEARVASMPGFEGRYVEADGYVLGLESFDQAADFTPMYRGLPDDLCQSHHWGYVIKGRMIFHRPEGDEVFEEGEANYAGPGHTGAVARPGTLIVEFSPWSSRSLAARWTTPRTVAATQAMRYQKQPFITLSVVPSFGSPRPALAVASQEAAAANPGVAASPVVGSGAAAMAAVVQAARRFLRSGEWGPERSL